MKTRLFLTLGVIFTMLLTGCGKKEVKILNPNVEGDLKGCFKVLDTVCEVTKGEDGKPSITVTIQRTDDSVPFTPKNVGTFGDENNDALVLAGFGYEGYNEKEENVGDVDADENLSYSSQQLDVLKLAPGEKANLTISFEKDVPDGIILTSELQFISTGEITLNGAIGRYGIKNFSIDFNFKNKKIIGQYQYLTSPAGAFLYLMGNVVTVDKSPGEYTYKIVIAEDNGKGQLSGKFKGELKLVRDNATSPYYYILLGTFRNKHYQDFRYDLKSAPLNEIEYGNVLKNSYAASMDPSFANRDFADYGFGSFAQESGYQSRNSGDVSVDELLRSYKSFFKKYISVVKKLNDNNPTVAMEYMELLSEYQDFTEKIAKVKGDMSMSQMNEFNRITQQITSEMSKINL